MISIMISQIYGTRIQLVIAPASKDLFKALYMKRNRVEKLIREDVNVISYEFESKNL